MPDRAIVFVDYQNAYWSAREAFHRSGASSRRLGHVDPMALARLIVSADRLPRELASARTYRGMPSPTLDPKGHRAWKRQTDQWVASGATVVSRVLRYPSGWPSAAPGDHPQEKGIDVALALDVVNLAHRQAFDVAILFSLDTDLLPVLEMIQEMGEGQHGPRIEVAAWRSPDGFSRRLRTPGRNTWCHWLDAAACAQVRDNTDYST